MILTVELQRLVLELMDLLVINNNLEKYSSFIIKFLLEKVLNKLQFYKHLNLIHDSISRQFVMESIQLLNEQLTMHHVNPLDRQLMVGLVDQFLHELQFVDWNLRLHSLGKSHFTVCDFELAIERTMVTLATV